jgi:hypothetical protein
MVPAPTGTRHKARGAPAAAHAQPSRVAQIRKAADRPASTRSLTGNATPPSAASDAETRFGRPAAHTNTAIDE